MAATAVEQSVDYTIETVLHKLDVYFKIAQCCVTCFMSWLVVGLSHCIQRHFGLRALVNYKTPFSSWLNLYFFVKEQLDKKGSKKKVLITNKDQNI